MNNENIIYCIKETTQDKNHIMENDIISNIFEIDGLLAAQINYAENYTVKDLYLIMDYYQLCKRKLKKTDLIEKITYYELNPENSGDYQERIRLWENIDELKNHSFFKKYILFNT